MPRYEGPHPVFGNCGGILCVNPAATQMWVTYFLALERWAADTEQLCKGDNKDGLSKE